MTEADARARQQQRATRSQKLDALKSKHAQLAASFDQFTKQRWATVQLLNEHGCEQHSEELAQHVQVLQACCHHYAATLGACVRVGVLCVGPCLATTAGSAVKWAEMLTHAHVC